MKTDILIVGCGVAGLYCALNLPTDKKITVITKNKAPRSDSFLAQGGICVLRDEKDYDSFYEDTMKAGHYENNPKSVDIMIRSSQEIIADLVSFGVQFEKDGERFVYTREGAHSRKRILFHEDETGKEITSHLLETVKGRPNITLIENFAMIDLVTKSGECRGIIGKDEQGTLCSITADYTVLATGGIGGLFKHSTNYRHLTGDAIALALKYGIKLAHIDYIQIHPTTLFTKKHGREFLISESVRGEGAVLLNSKGERFVNELLPRDVVANAIFDEMKKEGSEHVWLSLAAIPEQEIKTHFPNIYKHCLEEGYDITKESIPVVPSQHYFMGGIDVDGNSKTSMDRLYAVGETACNGVHGRNRLASNSLLESLVFAKRAAGHIGKTYTESSHIDVEIDTGAYENYEEKYKELVLEAIEKEKLSHE
ncbi:MAG: L-aspartate oxidase [Clostridia bacterium]|nr:L-aspartate oxidase [Clostridia bacterium]